MAARRGDVEAAHRRWVATLGALSPRQAAQVAQLYALAAQIDASKGSDIPLSAVAAVSRELRLMRDDLRTTAELGNRPPAPVPQLDTVDQVAAKRAQRRRQRESEGG